MTDTELEARLTQIEQDIADLKEAFATLGTGGGVDASTIAEDLQNQIALLTQAQTNTQLQVDKNTSRIEALETSTMQGSLSNGVLTLTNVSS